MGPAGERVGEGIFIQPDTDTRRSRSRVGCVLVYGARGRRSGRGAHPEFDACGGIQLPFCRPL